MMWWIFYQSKQIQIFDIHPKEKGLPLKEVLDYYSLIASKRWDVKEYTNTLQYILLFAQDINIKNDISIQKNKLNRFFS